MGDSRKRSGIFRSDAAARVAAERIDGWRREVEGQWPRGRLEVRPEELAKLLRDWKQGGLDPRFLLYVVLGCEWLLRARLATPKDVEAVVAGIEARLGDSLKGSLSAVQASLVINALESGLTKQIRRSRFLISLQEWAVPPSRWRTGRMRPTQLVRRKPGPIVNLGPIVATVIAIGHAVSAGLTEKRSGELGASLAGALLRRTIRPIECEGWRRKLVARPPDPEMAALSPPAANLLESVVRRWKRGYDFSLANLGWRGILALVAREPRTVFQYATDRVVVSMLYGTDWGVKVRRR